MMISNTISIVIYSYHQDGVFIKSACQKQQLCNLKKDGIIDDDDMEHKQKKFEFYN